MGSYIAPQYPLPNLTEIINDDPDKLLNQTFYLQPHVRLFTWEYDLFTFRGNFLKEEKDYWLDHSFPKLSTGKGYYFMLFRNVNKNLAWREITKEEFILLDRFKQGTTILDACAYIEEQEEAIYSTVAANLQKWLQEWSQACWLTLKGEA